MTLRLIAAFSAALMLTACMEDSPSSGTATRDTASDYRLAGEILEQRGFSGVAIMSLLQGQIFDAPGISNASRDALQQELEAKYGEANQMVYSEFEPDTGRKIPTTNIAEYAKVASPCLKNGQPWRDCRLNYQPVDGCFLEGEPLRFCRAEARGLNTRGLTSAGSPSQCWNYEKGPGVMLPYQAETKSEIDLAKAKVVQASAPAPAAAPAAKPKPQPTAKPRPQPAAKPQQTRVNHMGRPSCKHGYANGPVFDPFG